MTLHHADLPARDITAGTGFRVTTPIRSTIDLAATNPDADQLAHLLREGLQRGMFTVRTLRARAEEVDVRAALHIERVLPAVTA